MSISIRRSRSDQEDILLRLQKIALPADWPLVPDATNEWWIAWDGKKPVAFASLSKAADCAYLSRAGVIPKYRGKGIQKKLIAARVARARQQGWGLAVSYTINSNAASINSLLSCGFKAYVPKKPWARRGVCYWRKKIKPQKRRS